MEHGRKWWIRILLLAVIAILVIVGVLVIVIAGGPEAADSKVLVGFLAVVGALAVAAKWYFRRKHP